MQDRIEQIGNMVQKHRRAILYTFFDVLEDLELQAVTLLGPTHGRVQFAQGKCVIWDKRLLYMEQVFQKYLTWFNQNVQKDLPFYRKKILVYEDCSFVESLEEQILCTDTDQAFYQRLGSLAALVYALGGEKLDRHNIIRIGEHPVIRDVMALYADGYHYCQDFETESKILSDLKPAGTEEIGWMKEGYQKSVLFCKENHADVEELLKIYGGTYEENIRV